MLKSIADQYAFVAKLEVADITASVTWYTTKLDLEVDTRYLGEPRWRQLNMPGVPRVALGLWQAKNPANSGGAVATFVVENIAESRQQLIARGVTVSPIQDVGQGVFLCFFKDPDGNGLGLRQSGNSEPKPKLLGSFAR